MRFCRPRDCTPIALAVGLALGVFACAAPAQARIHIVFGSHSELALTLGGVQSLEPGPLGHDHWGMLRLDAGYRVGRHASFGVSAAGHLLGRSGVAYVSPSSEFLVTNETIAMTPATVYVKARTLVGRRGEPFVGAGAGGYTFWLLPDQPGGPRHVATRPGYHVEAGFAVLATRFSPRFELRYDERSTAPNEVGLLPKGGLGMVSVSVGVQLP